MAHFRATVKGHRSEASRLGTKNSGMNVSLHGWNVGLQADIIHDGNGKEDIIEVYLNAGSNAPSNRIFLGRYTENQVKAYLQEKEAK